MQDFATGKAFRLCGRLPELTCSYLKKIVSPQVGRIMKLTGILLLVACLHVSAKGVTQTVSLSEKSSPLIKVMKEIEQQTGYAFFYKNQWLTQAKRVTIQAENIPLQQALELCFKDQPFTYLISGKNISIKPKPNEKPVDKKNIEVSGKIMDKEGNPLTGANIKVKGTDKGTTTNADGFFSLKDINDDAVLEISYVGFETQLIYLKGRSYFAVNLNPKSSLLDEMQIIAYGTTTKRLNTGNVSTVKSTDIEKQPVNNPLLALEGRVPGMVITQSTGLPGSGISVKIRGQNSIINGTDPLYIVDGVPYTSQLLPGLTTILGTNGATGANSGAISGNPLAYINPADIESIDVLKDADATAIYGSRGANGVVLITTKNGKQGKLKVDINMQTGWGKVTKYLKLLNTQQYLQMRNEAIVNDGSTVDPNSDFDLTFWDSTKYTDWQKVFIGQTARYNDLQTSISGGSENIQYLVGGGYHKETTVFPGEFNDQTASIHFNVTGTSNNKKFQFTLSGNYLYDKKRLPQNDPTRDAITLPPNAPDLNNPDGSINWAYVNAGSIVPSWPNQTNPIALFKQKNESETYNMVSRATIGYNILQGLEAKVDFGYTKMQVNQMTTLPFSSIPPAIQQYYTRSSNFVDNNINSWIVEPQLKYSRKILAGNMNFLLGGTIQQKTSQGQSINANGFSTDDLIENLSAAQTIYGSTIFSQYKYNAVFGRINYNYSDKYLINLTGRRDGSSRFGAENRFQNFGAIGIGWVFSNESFVRKNIGFLSYGKIRGSYGTTGNDQIGDYSFTSLYIPISYGRPYQGISSLIPTALFNSELEWELTKKLEAGVELGFLQNSINVEASYYRNRSSNQLLSYKLPNTTGFTEILKNFPATVQNTGLELDLTTTNVKTKNFMWRTSFNLTVPKNKLISFPDLQNSSYNGTLFVGEPIGIYTFYKVIGVNDTTGQYQFEGPDGKPTYDPSYPSQYRSVHINKAPEYYGGFQNSFSWKGFQLDVLFQFTKQVGQNYLVGYNPGRPFINQPTTVLSRWQKPGDKTDIERYSVYGLGSSEDWFRSSNGGYTDASFIRLKNASFSWQLPQQWIQRIHFHDVRIFAHGQNLLTITNYKGSDPETQSPYSLPPLKVWTLGIHCGL
jgi:TonB-linked SusC/RagA family outer membrane protein